jgi:acyl-CoA synthetase (NDP forming)
MISITGVSAHLPPPLSRDLSPLWNPRSIALVGASADATKWGGEMALRFVRTEKRRPLYFVNRKGGTICGLTAYPSLCDLPEAPDMVYLSMPAVAFEATVEEALRLGAKAIVAILAGLGETGDQGKARERAVAERVRAAGALMIGPNCMGVADTTVDFQGVAALHVPPGSIGWVSMSGAMGEELCMRSLAAGVGCSRFVNLGNQADVTIAEVLRSYRDHEPTHVVAVYAEDMPDGRDLARALAELEEAGKPVVLMAPGRSAAAARAARSHTGSLAPNSAVLDAVARATGVVRVDTPGELFNTAVAFLHVVGLAGARASSCRSGSARGAGDGVAVAGLATVGSGAAVAGRLRLPAGRRIGIVTEGGGHGGMAADAVAAAGLEVPELSADTLAAVREGHPPSTGTNPIDFAIGTTDPDAYARTVPALACSGEIDAVLAVGQLGYWATRFAEFKEQVAAEVEGARRMALAAREVGVPMVVATVYPDAAPARVLREHGIPVFREIPAAARALSRLAGHALARPTGVPELLPPEPLVAANAPAARELASEEHAGGARSQALDYWAAREALASAGLELVPARLATVQEDQPAVEIMKVAGRAEREELPHVRRHAATVDRFRHVAAVEALVDEAAAAAGELGYPVAVKALGLLHKSDLGGVTLGLADEAAVRSAVAGMAARLGVSGVSVERMAPIDEGVELIIGCRQDPRFGPVLLVGLGGVYTELLRDVRTALAPVDAAHVETLLHELRGAPLLTGMRGRAALDIGAAVRAAAALSSFAAAHPEVAEVEVNPLLVLPRGALALDARIILEAPQADNTG